MPPATPPPAPRFVGAGDTDISIEWDGDPALGYRLQYKEYPESWEQARVLEVPPGHNQLTTASVPDLQPTCTYVLRLVAMSPEDGAVSAPGPEIVIDTQAADCTPKPGKRGCCVC